MKNVLILVAIVAMCSVAQAELLLNGDFEDGSSAPWNGWGSAGSAAYMSGGAFVPTYETTGGSDGGAWMELHTIGAGANSWASSFISQTVVDGVSGGDVLTVSGMAKSSTGSSLSARILFLDAAGDEVTYNDDAGDGSIWRNHLILDFAVGTDWTPFSQTITLDAGTGIAQMQPLYVVANGPEHVVGVDELSIVPEPATMALLGLGGVLIRRRRK